VAMEKILNRQMLKKPIFWVILSVISGSLAIEIFITSLKFGRIYFDVLSFIFQLAYCIFILVALGCGFKSIILLFQTQKILRLSGLAQLFFLILSGFYFLTLFLVHIDNYRSCFSSEKLHLDRLRHIRIGINAYMSANKQFPDANKWRYGISINNYDLSSPFAFNKNLSNASIEQSPGSIVLLVECDIHVNKYGAAELLTKTLKRDKYYLFPSQRFKYILFLDGTIIKYRWADGAISLYTGDYDAFGYEAYDKASKSFGPFQKQGTTPYSPLKWK
jgi:hypothetical protein